MATIRQYTRTTRIYLELLILTTTTMTLALTIPYVIHLWNLRPDSEDHTPKRASLILLYGVPPLFTLLISALNVFTYVQFEQPFVYGVFSTSLASAGWLVTTLIWGHCGAGTTQEGWMKWGQGICYQRSVSGYEIGALGMCVIVGGVVVLLCHLYGLSSAAQDLYHFRRGTLHVQGGLNEVTEDTEKRLRLRYSSTGSVRSEDSAEERKTLRAKRDLKQVTEDMEERLRMRYSGTGIVVVEEDVEERDVPWRRRWRL